MASGSVFGVTRGKESGLPQGIPISGVMGDQQSALYGQGCFSPGTIKNTYGTGCFLMLNTGKVLVNSKEGLLTTLACDEKGNAVYALEGAVFIAGAVIQWIRDQLKMINRAADSQKMIQGLKDNGGVYFVPAFTGLGAPHWRGDARGLICGLTRGSNSRHITRAALESIAYQTKDVFDLMRKSFGRRIEELRVDGGACENNFLMQFQSDLLKAKIIRPRDIESTACGAAYLAGVTTGLWTQEDLEKFHAVERVFFPKMKDETRKTLCDGWQLASRRVMVD